VLKKGWPFLFIILFLIWGLLVMRWELMTPYYASVVLLIVCFGAGREYWMTPKKLLAAFTEVGKLLSSTTAIFLPFGIILGAIGITGVGASLTTGTLSLGGGTLWGTMLLGVLACYVMGMVGLATIAYLMLAVTMAPVLIREGGLNALSVHLFILYYSMLAVFTPPVAAAAFMGASIAGSKSMNTAFLCMRLGIVIYFIPFFFVYSPALTLQAPIWQVVIVFVLNLIGIWLLAAALEGYLVGIGKLKNWLRLPVGVAGLAIAFPQWMLNLIGGALVVVIVLPSLWMIRRKAKAQQAQ
jgi:TRAP-type uncharacterized transport system fused permease subunit